MSTADHAATSDRIVCPVCRGELHKLGSARYGGPRLYAELSMFECAVHGNVFQTREGVRGADDVRGDDGGDAPVPVPRRPAPVRNAGAVALPETASD